MAWVSPKVYAILSSSEEGKDIIENLPDMTQEECQQELDRFFGEGGKGSSLGESYNQARADDEEEERIYREQGDREVSEEDYADDEDEEKNEVTDEDISEALADFEWQITQNTTVGQYAQETADKLGCSKEQVLKVIRNEDPNISEDMSMAKIAGLDDGEGEEEPKEEKKDFGSYEEYLKETAKKRWEDGSKYLDFDYNFDEVLKEKEIDKENFLKVYENVFEKSKQGEDKKIDLYEMAMRPIAIKLKNPKDRDIIGLGELEDGLDFYKEASKKYGV